MAHSPAWLLGLSAVMGLAAPALGWSVGGPRSETFVVEGVKIHYYVEGSGEPVVLIHALHSSSDINWRLTGVIRDLARDHQVISLDLPGHGRSDKPEDEAAYGIQMVDDIVLLLDLLKVEKAHVVGYSAGGIVALKLLAKHPDRTLSGTIGGMGWLREGSPIQKFWEQMPVRNGSRATAEFMHGIGKLALSEKELKSIKVPVEILIGDRDPVKRLYVTPLQGKRRDWPVIEILDAGHVNCIVKKTFREEIGKWVRKNTKREKT
jgi:pimeloyl-ACP methyl ester carboxylesterase